MLTQVNCTNNIGEKKIHEDEKTKKRGSVRKNMTQYLLFYSDMPNTSADMQERIKSDVRSQCELLGVTAVEKFYQSRLDKMVIILRNPLAVKHCQIHYCNFLLCQHLT